MKVLVPAESRRGESRVALIPDSVRRLVGEGLTVAVQSGAGERSGWRDDDYRAAGAEVLRTPHVAAALGVAEVVATVRPLHPRAAALLSPEATTVSFLHPVVDLATVAAAARAGATVLSFDLMPRSTRAQPMDALSSQALVSGYRAVLVAAERLPRFFPMFMTAAGTIPAARVLVLGTGVAGLQAIATARRLGAAVSAHDIRSSSAEEVRSLGATFLELGLESARGDGGYARELTEEQAERQRALLAPHVAAADVVVTTAAVTGQPAPLLVTTAMVEAMRPGSIVVDLAAEAGGNVEGAQPGTEVRVGGAIVWAGADVPSQLPVHASQLYSSNVCALIGHATQQGSAAPQLSDEIVSACAVVHRGQVRDKQAAWALGITDRGRPA
jgi:NAD(P) transhydrogenase subunit alpha